MVRSRCVTAIVAVLVGMAVLGVTSPVLAAQSDTVVVELTFVAATGEPPEGGVAVLVVNTGIVHLNDQVALGAPIEVDVVAGVANELQIRRTELVPGEISCEGAIEQARVRGSRVVVTPSDERVACTVTLVEAVAVPEELALTGTSSTLGLLALNLLGAGALMAAVSRSKRE